MCPKLLLSSLQFWNIYTYNLVWCFFSFCLKEKRSHKRIIVWKYHLRYFPRGGIFLKRLRSDTRRCFVSKDRHTQNFENSVSHLLPWEYTPIQKTSKRPFNKRASDRSFSNNKNARPLYNTALLILYPNTAILLFLVSITLFSITFASEKKNEHKGKEN